MLQQTRGLVLKSIKYGETSLITTIFTESAGIQTFLIQGVRTARNKSNKASMLQPATLLDLVVYQKPYGHLNRLKEFQYAVIYSSLQEQIIKNSIALFSVELLLRILPEQAPQPELFEFAFNYFLSLDQMREDEVANFPLYFLQRTGSFLGYELKGSYSESTPHLHLLEGGFSEHTPAVSPFVPDEDAMKLGQLMQINELKNLHEIQMNAPIRFRLIDWFLAFLHQHAQHLGQVKSLPVLQAILH